MQQNNGNNQDFTDKTSTPNEKKIEDMEDWRNEHGQPSFKFLQSLAMDGGPGALEKLKSIAQDLDVSYGPNTTAEALIRKILSAVRSGPRTTT